MEQSKDVIMKQGIKDNLMKEIPDQIIAIDKDIEEDKESENDLEFEEKNEIEEQRDEKGSFKKKVDFLDDMQFFSNQLIKNILHNHPIELLKSQNYIPPPSMELQPNKCVRIQISCGHDPILLGGSYLKYSRELPQTPWNINDSEDGLESDRPTYDSSVQEEIEKIVVPLFKPKGKCFFHSAGREDVDVRMLPGSEDQNKIGRKFIFEITQPRYPSVSNSVLAHVTQIINSNQLIEIHSFRPVSKLEFTQLKDGAINKKKVYQALIWVKEAQTQERINRILSQSPPLTLSQLTPLRVLHRRTLASREKIIYSMKLTHFIAPHFFILQIITSAGTYVKEFVHSDLGRTQPNVGSLLGTDSDILQLDVLDILEDSAM
ncbi:MAG: putative tRNA pseudouridine synthase [Streblomastix strix]|uniref:tRNA pseudouridine(55) synthase n=1 Tax=Streblomastix strix TaxID=222440 RepID=A0A5J4WFR6_9EUKA|nr:MAG: putative tRNA pseudouridine synthase [Streblomastix strix]